MSTNNHRVEQLFAKVKTICVGRFLLDVPETAEIIYGPSSFPWSIESYPNQGNSIDAVISSRLTEIESERELASDELRDKDSLVGKVISGMSENQKIVFGVSKGSSWIYRIDSYIKVDNDLFVQQATAMPKERESVVRDLKVVAALLSARGGNEVPVRPGACIEAGFVGEPYRFDYESYGLGVRLAEFPDVHFSISMTKKDKFVESDALEPRLKEAEQIAKSMGQGSWYSRIKNLRRGHREIGRWKGFEILTHKPAQSAEGESHEFAYVSQGAPKSPLLPLLEVELHTGVKGNQIGADKPSVTDEEAVSIWDKLTNSIRARPVSDHPD